MAENNKPTNKASMPEHIRKMFEAKGMLPKQDTPAPPVQNSEQNKQLEPEVQEVEPVDQTQPVEDVEVQDNNQEENAELETTSEKPKKIKKEKQPKEKKEKTKMSKKKKKLILILSAVALVVAVALVFVIMYIVDINKKMEAPVVSVYNISNETRLYVEKNDRAVSYEFYIKKKGVGKTTSIPSSSNEISLQAYLKEPGSYEIYAKYIGINDNATSNASKTVVYENYEKLSTPVVTKNATTLAWTPVSHAQKYYVYYGVKDGQAQYLEVQASSSTENVVFNLSEIDKLGAGAYTLYVMAVGAENSYYSSSELSSAISYVYSTKLIAPTNVVYNASSHILTFSIDTTKVYSQSFLISVNNGQINFEFDINEISQTIVVDMLPFVSSTTISSITVASVGDGTYTTNSDASSATFA